MSRISIYNSSIVLKFLILFPIHLWSGGGSFLDVVPRSKWWADEWKSASTSKKVKVSGRGRRAKYRTVIREAPSKDIKGFCQRTWVEGSCKVSGYKQIVWHHTDSRDQYPNLVSMALFHQGKHFCDLAYHFVIKKNSSGRWAVYEGTPLGYVGSHAGGCNFIHGTRLGTIGIAVAGDFGQQKPDAELKKVMTKLQDRLVSRYKIRSVGAHRDGPYAVNDGHDCPGKYMVPFISELHNRAAH
ncbi:MAG: N-acetylmuramoyl-L-alanine amidase [Proteobacteria bacterium]|nr:N-acetylmuramoyl-L-alanine amidase [Pseudomonadota bacterium]